MKSSSHYFTYIILAFLLLTPKVKAQTPELYNSISNDVYSVPSKILNQDRKIYIHAPKIDSSNLNQKFPVLYLLDGENHFHLLSAYIDYLSHWKVIPQIIVVGIINIDRKKDLTPTHSIINFDGKTDLNYNTTGGNEQFLQFIEKELIPYIETKYKANPYKIFAGHSFGGIAAINCMLTRPNLFSAYVAVSPSFWWDNTYILKLTEKTLAKIPFNDKKLFYSNGNEGGSFRGDLIKFDSLIKNSGLNGIKYRYKDYPDESHMTEPIVAYYDALKFIFQEVK